MTYTMDESHTSNNYTPNASVQAVFGYPRTFDKITIHHWGDNGQQFNVVRDYLCTNTTPTSAHFVAMAGQVACIVSPYDAAWHAGNALGNASSIGIECHPEATDADYQTIAELIAWLRNQYGPMPLVPHNYWTSTSCPGDYDLGRLDTMAQAVTPQSTTITPIKESPMAIASADLQAIARAVWGYRNSAANDPTDMHQTLLNAASTTPAAVWAYKNTAAGDTTDMHQTLINAAQPVTVALTQDQINALADNLRAALPAATVAALAAKLA